MQVPVYYRYQRFAEVIALQPLPVSVDVQVWFDHLLFFDRLTTEFGRARDIPQGDARVVPLLDREDNLVTLSPLGELMGAAVNRLIESSGEAMLPAASPLAPEAKKVVFEDHNAGKHPGLREFCDRLRQVPYVVRIGTYYFNPDLPKPSRVALDPGGRVDCLDVWYGDGSRLTKLHVWTTAKAGRETAAARADLARQLGLNESR